jgi:tetratricopeptide (TPR) repeat protein
MSSVELVVCVQVDTAGKEESSMTGHIAFAILTEAVLGGHHQLKSPRSKTCYGFLSHSRILMRDARISWFLGVLVLLLLGWIAQPGISQAASNQIVDQSFRAQQLVSKNQLLTPEKALKATGRAREDLLHGKQESARKEIQRALDVSPHCALALSLQGIVSYQDKDYAEAAHAFQQSIEEDSTLGTAYLGLGTVFMIQGRFREALIPLGRAAALLPDSWFTHFQTALAHLGLRESAGGLKEIAEGERFAGDDAERRSGFAYLRGVAYLQLENYGAAKESLQQTVTSSPKGAYAPLARKRLEQLNPIIDKSK